MNFFLFVLILAVALFLWIYASKKKIVELTPDFQPSREAKPVPLDPIHLWEAEPILSSALNARVQQCSDCQIIRLHPCQCEQPFCSICAHGKPNCKCPGPFKGIFGQSEPYERYNIQLPKGSKYPYFNGEDCNRRYKIDRYGGTLASLQDLRKHWIASGHKNVPDPKCYCGYDGPGLNYYRDRNGDKIFCSLHPNVK